MADELAEIHDLLACAGTVPRLKRRPTPWHLQDVVHLAYLRRKRIVDVKWNTLTEKLLRMNDRPRICLLLPLPRPPTELPLADAINLDVAQFLSIPDDEPV
jgi:hypothetical protein